MEQQFVQQIGRIVNRFDVLAMVDIAILTVLVYSLSSMLRGTRAETLARGLIILFACAFILVTIWPLPVLRWLVTNSLQFFIFASIVIFSPELRRALERLGHTGDFINRPLISRNLDNVRSTIEEVVTAAFYLSNQRWGGLMVMERETGLQDLANRGIEIGAQVTSQMLGNLFVPNTPLHDGAVIIRGDKIIAAKVTLPLSDNVASSEQFGTRHKAAIGVSEQSDAVVVVVSEETGSVSIVYNGKLHYKLDRDRLRLILRSLLEPTTGKRRSFWSRSPTRQLESHKAHIVGTAEKEAEPVGQVKKTEK